MLDADGPGMVSHIWFTIDDNEPYSLKRIVLRMYWDNETTPSVETPIGDFFGLGNGLYYKWESMMLSAGNDKALNSYFPMPYAHHARITVTNEGKEFIAASLLEHRLPPRCPAAAQGHALLPRAIPPGAAEPWMDRAAGMRTATRW